MMFLAIKNPLLGRSKKDSIEATGFKLEDCRVEEERSVKGRGWKNLKQTFILNA